MARYMYYTGAKLSAQELYHFGNITKIVPDETLLDEAVKLAETFKTASPNAVKIAKRALWIMHSRGQADDRELALMTSEIFFRNHFDERLEALHAFIEKRPPKFFE